MRINFPNGTSSVYIPVKSIEQALYVEKILNKEHPYIPRHKGASFAVTREAFNRWKKDNNEIKFFIYHVEDDYLAYGLVCREPQHTQIPFTFNDAAELRKRIRQYKY